MSADALSMSLGMQHVARQSAKRYQPIVWAEVETVIATRAAGYVARRYGRYGVTLDDAKQEALVWLYANKPKVERYLSSEPQQYTRIYRSLLDAAMQYAESEKAVRLGYEVDDVQWYTPRMIEAVMPLVLDPTYDGTPEKKDPSEGGGKKSKPTSYLSDAFVAVLDVRRALALCPEWVHDVFLLGEPGVTGWDDAVQYLINRLGGDRPRVGSRHSMSNAAAQSYTAHQEAGE